MAFGEVIDYLGDAAPAAVAGENVVRDKFVQRQVEHWEGHLTSSLTGARMAETQLARLALLNSGQLEFDFAFDDTTA